MTKVRRLPRLVAHADAETRRALTVANEQVRKSRARVRVGRVKMIGHDPLSDAPRWLCGGLEVERALAGKDDSSTNDDDDGDRDLRDDSGFDSQSRAAQRAACAAAIALGHAREAAVAAATSCIAARDTGGDRGDATDTPCSSSLAAVPPLSSPAEAEPGTEHGKHGKHGKHGDAGLSIGGEIDLPEGELKGGKHGKHGKHGDADLSIGGKLDLPEGELKGGKHGKHETHDEANMPGTELFVAEAYEGMRRVLESSSSSAWSASVPPDGRASSSGTRAALLERLERHGAMICDVDRVTKT